MIDETVKVEVELPKGLHDAIMLMCDTFDDDPNEFIVRALVDDVEATGDNLFVGYVNDLREKVMKILRGEYHD